MKRTITMSLMLLFSFVTHTFAQESAAPGRLEVALTPAGGTFFTDRSRPDFGNYSYGGALTVNLKGIPSHQSADAQTVDPELDVVTTAVKVPETLAHLHYWSVQMTREASKEDVLDAFRRSSRIALIRIGDGLGALNAVKELMADRGRPHDNLYDVALWSEMLQVRGDELFYAYMVDNQAIVIPETIDAIRALTGIVEDATESIAKTNAALGLDTALI
jgi:glyceraldehyde-3-phosphate dehydrogenase type II